ncbi:MAG: HAD family phosphatase [Armatimonadetes bacterium]|nr:HAD family phosphatase [Armatimonadota bacterium]
MTAPLLLDLDGTLIDSEPWYKGTEVDILNDLGVPITLPEMEEFTGLTLPVWLIRVEQRFGKAVEPAAFLEAYRPRMVAHVQNDIRLFPDAERFLESLDGRPAVLVTSSLKWYVDEVLERFPLIADSVSGVVCEADVTIGKPDPEPYVKAAQRLGVDPGTAWVVEDAPNGVKSGLDAGCQVAWMDRNGHPMPHDPHLTVHTFEEFSEALAKG